jgi:hypothetical protein
MTKDSLVKSLALALFVIGWAALSFGQPTTPEIDPASGVNALALLAGALLIVRSRRS